MFFLAANPDDFPHLSPRPVEQANNRLPTCNGGGGLRPSVTASGPFRRPAALGCVVFGKLSEFAKTLTKGAHIQVEGELRSREYTSKKTDSKQRVWEIRVASILKLDRAEKAAPDDQEKDQEHDESSAEEVAA
jgi:single-stranded DNA-binding protein